jgi:DNA-binding response OmpR family regulator
MNNKVIYILEDDPDISELIAYILSDAGYQVEQFESVRQFNEVTTHHLAASPNPLLLIGYSLMRQHKGCHT